MRGMSRKMIYRAFGENEASRVYPQQKGKALTEISQDFADEVDKIEKGYPNIIIRAD